MTGSDTPSERDESLSQTKTNGHKLSSVTPKIVDFIDPWETIDTLADNQPLRTRADPKNPNNVKLAMSEEEEWKNAWYQKVDNKKLILDTMENDSYGKNNQHREKEVSVSIGGNKENRKQRSASISSQNSTENNDDVFLPASPTAGVRSHGNTVQSPKFRIKPFDLNNENYLGKADETDKRLNVTDAAAKVPDKKTIHKAPGLSNTDATWKVKPQTTVIESTSLFKSEQNVSKPLFPDFKVTIQNTAQFISVMESPASPELETGNMDKGSQFLLPSPSSKNRRSNVLLNENAKTTHVNKQPGCQMSGDISGVKNEVIGSQSTTTKPLGQGSDITRKTSNSNGTNSSPKKTSDGSAGIDSKYKTNRQNQRSPIETSKLHTQGNKPKSPPSQDVKSPKTQSQDSILHFNKTLQEIHNTLQQISRGAMGKKANDDTKEKHQNKIPSPSQDEQSTNITDSEKKVKTAPESVFKHSDPRLAGSAARNPVSNSRRTKM